jgi:hypothetical protein
MGESALGVVSALQAVKPEAAREPDWFAAFGVVIGGVALLALGFASLIPGLAAAGRRGGRALAVRLAHGGLFGVLLWSHPLPALWVFALPNLLGLTARHRLRTLLALLPLGALAGVGLLAARRGLSSGLWLGPWELMAAAAALGLLGFSAPAASSAPRRGRRRGSGRAGRS